MNVKVTSAESVQLELAGAAVTLSAQTLADLWIERITRGTTTAPLVTFPRLGELWPGQGGIYIGMARGLNNAPDYPLIMAEAEKTKLGWNASGEWAKALVIDGHRDYTLPTRREQHLMIAIAKEMFAPEWYWSSEQFAPYGGSAWAQYFDDGNQSGSRKGSEYRARAVRRLSI